MSDGPNGSGASRYRIMKTVEDSLKRLKTDRIDLYQIHMQDMDTPEEETLRALDDLIHQGKVLYIGCSNYAAYRLVESLLTSEKHNLHKFVSLQAKYNLVERSLELEHIPACRKFGVGIIPWSPLAGGFLSGKYQKDQNPPEGSRLSRWQEQFGTLASEKNWRVVETMKKVANAHEATPAQTALAWLLTKPTVSSVIFGAKNMKQLEDNLKAAKLQLSPEAILELDAP